MQNDKDPRDAASNVTKLSEYSEKEEMDSINLGYIAFVVGTTAFFLCIFAGSGSSGSVTKSFDTDSLL